jgi:hypothetical protein
VGPSSHVADYLSPGIFGEILQIKDSVHLDKMVFLYLICHLVEGRFSFEGFARDIYAYLGRSQPRLWRIGDVSEDHHYAHHSWGKALMSKIPKT